MSGTVSGGRAAAQTNKELYGDDFYKKLGAKGAEAYRKRQEEGTAKPRGFAANRERARIAGAIGGRISRRRKSA